MGTDAFLVAGILPAVATDMDVSIRAAGQVVSAYALTYAVGSPVLAALGGRLPRRTMIMLALGAHMTGNLVCAFAPSFAWLLLGRVLAGAAAAVATPTCYMLAAHLAPIEKQGAALGAAAMGLAISTVVGVPAGVWAAHLLGWHAAFFAVVACSGLALAAVAFGGLPLVVPTGSVTLAARLAPLGRKRVLLVILPHLFWTTGGFMTYTYIAPFVASRGIDLAWLPGLLLVYGLGCIAGTQMGGRLRDRFGLRRPLLVLLVAGTLNQALMAAGAGNLAVLAFTFFLWPTVAWGVWAPQQGRLIECEPRNPAVVLALANSVVYAAAAIAAASGAAMLPWIGLGNLPVAGAVLYACALVLLWRINPEA